MSLSTVDMPLKSFKSIPREFSEEYRRSLIENPHLLDLENNDDTVVNMYHSQLQPPVISVCKKSEENRLKPENTTKGPWLIDIIHFGWRKTLRILANVHFFISKLRHKVHSKLGKKVANCKFCDGEALPMIDFEKASEMYIFRTESEIIVQTTPALKLRSFRLDNGILVYDGRLNEDNPIICKDIEFDVFFDRTGFNSCTYAVRPDSPVFYAYLLFIHLHLACVHM